jgi:Flp pilus assembly protein TadD
MLALMVGCTTRTVVIKDHPADTAPQQVKKTKIKVSDNHLEQGKRLYFREKYSQATKHLIRSIANDNTNWEAYYYLGLTQQKRKRFDRAIGSFNNSLKYVPSGAQLRAQIFYALGVSWEKEGYLEKARQMYTQAVQLNPEYAQAKVANDRVKAKLLTAEIKKKTKKQGGKAF